MKKDMGLWIDHKRAVVVTLLGEDENVTQVTSDAEKHVQSSNGHDNSAEDKRDRRIGEHLHKYYAEIATLLHNADDVLIMGPGEAKGEFRK